jgi:hypothetical protein
MIPHHEDGPESEQIRKPIWTGLEQRVPKSLADFGRLIEYKNENEDIKRAKNDVKTKILGLIKRGYVRI